MTQPNQSELDEQMDGEELDEILQKMANYVYNASVAARNYGIFIGGNPMQEAKAAIQAYTNAEIAKAKLEAFDVAFDCHDYDRLRAYRAKLLKEVK